MVFILSGITACMPSFHQLAKNVIRHADILLMVVDARQPDMTVNEHLIELIGEKKLLYVINKIDLVEERDWLALKRKLRPSVAVSATNHLGTMMLLRKINEIARGEEVTVGVIGYPNTGKSSLINALRNRASTSVSPVAGHTRALQNVRVSKNVLLIDSPGVLPRDEAKDEDRTLKHQFLGTIDVNRIKEPDLALFRLMDEYPGMVEKYYGLPVGDHEETLAAIAKEKKQLGVGGAPDIQRMARQILRDFQLGKMRHT
jgi:ribosome biogenesis GTPase A